MKTIGFVDYYISEWHANNYPAWIAAECAKAGLDYSLAYVWAEREISPVDGRSTAEWCKEFGAEKCDTLEKLCEKSDVIVLLAPSDPDKHLPYARTALSYGKPTYIDKTFAPNLAEAREIFALAEKYGTPFFSTSALRYEKGLDTTENCRHLTVFQSGSSLQEYVIHAIEMVVKTLGTGADSVLCAKNGQQQFFHLGYPDDRTACMVYAPFGLPGLSIQQGSSDTAGKTVPSNTPVFNGLIADMLRFFETGIPSFDPAQTLEVMRIRDAVLAASAQPGTRVGF